MNVFQMTLLSSAVLSCLAGDAGAQSVPCAPSTDGFAQANFDGVKVLVSDTSASSAGWRADADLPLTSASAVIFVTSDSICTAAANLTAQMEPNVPVHAVWVLAIGPSRYMVFDKERRSAGRLLVANIRRGVHLAGRHGGIAPTSTRAPAASRTAPIQRVAQPKILRQTAPVAVLAVLSDCPTVRLSDCPSASKSQPVRRFDLEHIDRPVAEQSRLVAIEIEVSEGLGAGALLRPDEEDGRARTILPA